MKFSFSSEQDEFRSNLRRLLTDRSPTKEVRRLMETDHGYERDSWRAIDNELGLTAIRIPEAYGGYGLIFGDQCIVLEEMGRALLCAPYFATAVLAAGAIMNAGTEAEKEALDRPRAGRGPAGEDADRVVVRRVAPDRLGDADRAGIARHRQLERHGLDHRHEVDEQTREPRLVGVGET